MYRLENWSVVVDFAGECLQGQVYNHPNFPEGYSVRTSAIKSSNGRTVITASGSKYTLGNVDPNYVKWCENQGLKLDEEQPVKSKRLDPERN